MAKEKGYPPKVKKGALHKQAGIKKGKKIGLKRLEKMKHSSSPKERKRANFAINFAYKGGKKSKTRNKEMR